MDAIPHDTRISQAVDVIRHYVTHTIAGWPSADYSVELRNAVEWLAVLALQHNESLIATRLRQIARAACACVSETTRDA